MATPIHPSVMDLKVGRETAATTSGGSVFHSLIAEGKNE